MSCMTNGVGKRLIFFILDSFIFKQLKNIFFIDFFIKYIYTYIYIYIYMAF